MIDRILEEPVGGAHREREAMMNAVGDAVIEEIDALTDLSPEALRKSRRKNSCPWAARASSKRCFQAARP